MVQRSLWLYLTYASQAIWGLSGKEGRVEGEGAKMCRIHRTGTEMFLEAKKAQKANCFGGMLIQFAIKKYRHSANFARNN